MSTRHVRKWMIAAPIIGFCSVGCGSSNTTFTGLGGTGSGGTTSGGSGGEQGGSGGSSAGTDSGGSGGAGSGGSGGSGGTAGSGGAAGSSGSGGSGGSGGSAPDIGYEPVGIGDPWFFDAEADMSAFTFAVGGGDPNDTSDDAIEAHSWSNGEIHISATFDAAGDIVQMQFTTPWNSITNTADLSGRVIKARVRVAAGATAGAGVQVFTQSNGWSWVTGDWSSIADLGSYTDVTFPMTSAADAADVQRFGLQLYATSAGTVELIIDDLRLEPDPVQPGPDGGVSEPDGGGGDPPPVDAGGGEPDAGGGLGYEPVGMGDPWFFDQQSEMNLFTIAPGFGSGATLGTASLSGGEVHIPATFATAGDTIQMYINTPYDGSINTADMTGRVLMANVRIGAGATISGGGVQLIMQSGGWQWANGGWNDISGLGSTAEVSEPLTTAVDASNVQQIGVQLYASSAGSAELIIDDIRIEPAP